MTTTTHSPLDALAVGNRKRLARAQLRREVREGRVSLPDVLADPPPELADVTLFDVALWANRNGRRRTAAVERLGRLALVEGVNLAMPVGRASVRSRLFVAEHAGWHARRGGER